MDVCWLCAILIVLNCTHSDNDYYDYLLSVSSPERREKNDANQQKEVSVGVYSPRLTAPKALSDTHCECVIGTKNAPQKLRAKQSLYRCSYFSVDSMWIYEWRIWMIELLDLLVRFRFRWFQGGILRKTTCLVHMSVCVCVWVLEINAPIWKFKYGYIIGSGIGDGILVQRKYVHVFVSWSRSVPNTTYCITSSTVTTSAAVPAVAAPSNGSTPWQIYILPWNHPVSFFFVFFFLRFCSLGALNGRSRRTNKVQKKKNVCVRFIKLGSVWQSMVELLF